MLDLYISNAKDIVNKYFFVAVFSLCVLVLLDVLTLCLSTSIDCDAPRAWGLYYQDSASPQMEALVELHDNIMYYLVAIFFAVCIVIVTISLLGYYWAFAKLFSDTL